jgi:hypothetical protein
MNDILITILIFETCPIGKFQLKSYSQLSLWMNLPKVSRTKEYVVHSQSAMKTTLHNAKKIEKLVTH